MICSGSSLSGEVDNPSRLDRSAVIAKVSLRHEAPVQRTGEPILHALHVQLDVPVDVVPPRGDSLLILDERMDTLLAHLADAIYGLLKAEPIMCHENVDQVMRLAATLFDIVREYILKRSFFKYTGVGRRWRSRWTMIRDH